MIIPIAHDFICPWCWVGFLQAKRLQEQFKVDIEWLGYELWPVSLEWPEPGEPAPEPPANKPKTPSRLDFICHADGLEMPTAERPKRMRTFNAHQAIEFAKTEGVQDALIEAYYRAYWEKGLEINDPKIAVSLAAGIVTDLAGLASAIETNRFDANIVDFDDPAYETGVYNVPTFFIGGHKYAEQPYVVLERAMKAL